ncbi:hypothetical protein ACI1TW_03315 [Lactococcus garvieae]|uniref:hypothetical protein n=1 Tax=Lactococcus garvieae TaxID=1363 RepID=UPI0038536889
MDQQKFELMIGLFIIAIGSFIMGAAAVGIQLEKIKRQRDAARKRVRELEKCNWKN